MDLIAIIINEWLMTTKREIHVEKGEDEEEEEDKRAWVGIWCCVEYNLLQNKTQMMGRTKRVNKKNRLRLEYYLHFLLF